MYKCVEYNGILFNTLPLISGVSEDSCFSPVLWNADINGLLVNLLLGNCLAYDDDVMFVASATSHETAIQKTHSLIDAVADWANLNYLSFTHAKCNVMVIHTKRRRTEIRTCNIINECRFVRIVRQMTILGAIAHGDRLWQLHANKVRGKLNG